MLPRITLAGQGIAAILIINSIRIITARISIILVITEFVFLWIPSFHDSLLLYIIYLKKAGKVNLTAIAAIAKVWCVAKMKGGKG